MIKLMAQDLADRMFSLKFQPTPPGLKGLQNCAPAVDPSGLYDPFRVGLMGADPNRGRRPLPADLPPATFWQAFSLQMLAYNSS